MNAGFRGVSVPAVLRYDDWIPAPKSWSWVSTDGPTFVVNAYHEPNNLIGVGDRVKIFQGNSHRYGIVQALGAYAGGKVPLTVYCGTDYILTAGAPMLAASFSHSKCPYGFPPDPDKWTLTPVSNTSNVSQASPTSGTWYNLGSLSGDIHIGAWRVFTEHAVEVNFTIAAATLIGVRSTLSTANNSESDAGFTGVHTVACPAITGGLVRASVHREKILNLSVKTTYFLNANTGVVGATSINFRGDSIATIVKAVSAYL